MNEPDRDAVEAPTPQDVSMDWESEARHLRQELGYWRDIAQASLGLLDLRR